MRIVKQDPKEGEIRLVCENSEDLWHVERLLQPGDYVAAKTFRRFKATEDDSGEKKPVSMRLLVEKAEFSRYANRLRVSGKITWGEPEEFVQIGSHHTIDVEEGFPISVIKQHWLSHHLSRIKQAVEDTRKPRVSVLVLDESRAIFATLRGYGVHYELELENPTSKRDDKFEEKGRQFFGEILKKLQSLPNNKIIIAGPGFAKDNLYKFLCQKDASLSARVILESCSYAERSGVNELLKRGVVLRVAHEERVENELRLMEKFCTELGKGSGLVAYGKAEVGQAVRSSAAATLLVLDELLRNDREVEAIAEEAEKARVKLAVFSHESDGGRELAGFSGIAALLRFRID